MSIKLVIGALLLVTIATMAYTEAGKFTGAENHNITLEEASALASNYQMLNPDGAKSHFFGRDAIQKILAQDGVVGIRVYYGLAEDSKQHLIMVGTDANQNDLVQGLLAERAPPCPPFCGNENDLNNPAQESVGNIAIR